MQKTFLLTICIIFSYSLFAQHNSPDDIIGYYYSIDPFTKEGSQTYIYKNSEGKYEGKVCWVENPEKKKFLNLVYLKELEFSKKDNEWQNGIAKYPGKKGTFTMYMSFVSPKKLKVRGYWGIALLGKTLYWQKENQQRIQH